MEGMFMFGSRSRFDLSKSIQKIKRRYVSADDLNYEKVKKKNDIMLRNNVSISRLF